MFNHNYGLIDLGNAENTFFMGARAIARTSTVDYATGGAELNDATSPFNFDWRAVSNGSSITLSKKINTNWQDKKTLSILSDDFSFSFDKSMNHVIAFTYNNRGYINFFDSRTSQYINRTIGDAITTPRLALDDSRYELLPIGEVVCVYIRNGKLRVRKQSEDYLAEHILNSPIAVNSIIQIGMSNKLRIMFKCE